MTTPRTWRREARLLLAIGELAKANGGTDVEDVLALEFLMQHPSALTEFASLSGQPWPLSSLPSVIEAESSEETLLRWKRSVGASVLAPLLGRLIARGLVTQASFGILAMSDAGQAVHDRLGSMLNRPERERLMVAAGEFASDPLEARNRLRRSLDGRAS